MSFRVRFRHKPEKSYDMWFCLQMSTRIFRFQVRSNAKSAKRADLNSHQGMVHISLICTLLNSRLAHLPPGLLVTEGPPLDGTTALTSLQYAARGAMQIFCWGVVQGQTITLDVHPNTTVATVKAKIYRQTGKCPSAHLPACRRRRPPLSERAPRCAPCRRCAAA